MGLRRPCRSLGVTDHDSFFRRLTELLVAFKMQGPSLADVLLEDGNPHVVAELARRSERQPRGWESATINTHRMEWQKLGLRWQATQAADADRNSPWFTTLCMRQRDNLAYHQAKHHSAQDPKVAARRLGVDLGQSISRLPHSVMFGDTVIAPTLLPNSVRWVSSSASSCSTRTARPILGVEALAIQGWPVLHERFREARAGKEPPFLMNLAGNAFPGTMVVALICGMVFAAEGAGDEHSSSVDRSSAAASIALLQEAQGL